MRTINTFVLLTFFVCSSCKREIHSNQGQLIKKETENNEILIDSAAIRQAWFETDVTSQINRIDSLQKNSDLLYVIQNYYSFNKTAFINKWDSTHLSQLLTKIEIRPFNNFTLSIINYDEPYIGQIGNSIVLILYDSLKQLIDLDTIHGCHYHNGKITIDDWDHDGSKDILYKIGYPLQSVPVIDSIFEVHALNPIRNKFYKKFEITLESRVCGPPFDEDSCTYVSRNIKFSADKKRIDVLERQYYFNNENFEWHKPINGLKLFMSKKYSYIYNLKTLTYESEE